jgi:hypothetical protein
MEKSTKNTSVKSWVLKSRTLLQFLNGKNIRIYFFQTWVFKPIGACQRPYKYPNDQNMCQFILNNNSKTQKEDSSKMWLFKSTRACERPYSNPNDQTCVILYQRQLNSRVLFKLWPFEAHQLKPRNDYPIKCPVSKVHQDQLAQPNRIHFFDCMERKRTKEKKKPF